MPSAALLRTEVTQARKLLASPESSGYRQCAGPCRIYQPTRENLQHGDVCSHEARLTIDNIFTLSCTARCISPTGSVTFDASQQLATLALAPAANLASATSYTAAVKGAKSFVSYGGTAGMTNQGIDTVISGDIGTTAVSTGVTGLSHLRQALTQVLANWAC